MYPHAKFHFNNLSRLGCVFYTTNGLAANLDPRWRLFSKFRIFFPLPTHGPTPSCQIWCF